MITGVFGLTGSGKSTFLAWCADRAQKGKKLQVGFSLAGGVRLGDMRRYDKVYSTSPILGCYQLNFADLGVCDFQNSLMLIDEIMMLCDSRDWKNFPENIKYFMSHHRHYCNDVIWCSQSYRDTDLRIRSLSQQFLYIRPAGGYTCVTPIAHLMDIRNGVIDDWYELGGLASRRYVRRSRYYHMFDSHSKKELLPAPECLWEI